MDGAQGGSFEDRGAGSGTRCPLPWAVSLSGRTRCWSSEPGPCAGGNGPALTVASGPHCGVCPGSSFSWEQSRRWSGPAASGSPALGCRLQAALTLVGPSGLSSRSMEETLSRLFRRPMPAKGLAMTPGDT